ncbi:hypothetical protein ACKKBF_B41105 [Auxenochlorella protothecoides x Auxenochlorella symbiontica]
MIDTEPGDGKPRGSSLASVCVISESVERAGSPRGSGAASTSTPLSRVFPTPTGVTASEGATEDISGVAQTTSTLQQWPVVLIYTPMTSTSTLPL